MKGISVHGLVVISFSTGLLLVGSNIILASATSLVPLENNNWLSRPIVTAGNSSSSNVQAAVSGDNMYLVWEGDGGVMFAKSSDGGTTFSSPIILAKRNPGSSVSQSPQLTIFQDNVFVVYTSGKDVFLLRNTDAGRTFSSPINVSRMGVEDSADAVVYDPIISVADGGKRVYVGWIVWQQMYFSQSADGGITFGTHTNVSKEGETVISAKIASYNRNVYLAWSGVDESNINHISFARSNDWGYTFQSISNISANNPPYSSFEPQVAVTNFNENTVYLIWRDEVPLNQGTSNWGAGVAFARSTDSGRSFNITRYIGSGAWPALSLSGKNIYVASGVQENGTENIGFVESLDRGTTFSKQIMLSNQTWSLNPYDDRPYPAITADGANVFVAWRYTASGDSNDSSNHETFLAASYDEGRTFTSQLNVSASKAGDTRSQPIIVASPVDRVFVLWPEEVFLNNYTSSKIDLMLSKGQIPEAYTKPFRQVSYITPVEPYNPTLALGVISAVAVGIAVVGGMYFLRKRRIK